MHFEKNKKNEFEFDMDEKSRFLLDNVMRW